jgi:hypothetical protein
MHAEASSAAPAVAGGRKFVLNTGGGSQNAWLATVYTLPASPREEQHVRDVLRFFFPNDPPPLAISEELGNFTARILHQALIASRLINSFPRVPSSVPTFDWLISEAFQSAWRTVRDQHKILEMVRNAIALGNRSEYERLKLVLLCYKCFYLLSLPARETCRLI